MDERRLGIEFGLSAEDAPNFRSKAMAWRGLMSALHAKGLFEEVLAVVPAPVQRYMQKPPLGISWMPAIAFQYVFRALEGQVSAEQMQELAHMSILRGPFKAMSSVVEGMLRLFGSKPEAFLERLPKVMAQQLEGVTFEVEKLAERSVRMMVRYEYVEDLPPACFAYWVGVLTVTFEICGISDGRTELAIDDRGRTGMIHFHW